MGLGEPEGGASGGAVTWFRATGLTTPGLTPDLTPELS